MSKNICVVCINRKTKDLFPAVKRKPSKISLVSWEVGFGG